MADYITSTTSSSIHSSPNRKRARDSLATRSSSYLSSCKAAVTATSNVEVMESLELQTPTSITQPRSSIHSIQNGLTSIKTKSATTNGVANTNGIQTPPPIIVSYFFHFTLKN